VLAVAHYGRLVLLKISANVIVPKHGEFTHLLYLNRCRLATYVLAKHFVVLLLKFEGVF